MFYVHNAVKTGVTLLPTDLTETKMYKSYYHPPPHDLPPIHIKRELRGEEVARLTKAIH